MFGNFYRGKKVFVTGHTGFKGAWLTEWLLLLGAEVTGYSLEPGSDPSLFCQLGLAGRLNHILGEIRDPVSLETALHASQADIVFHLAAQPLVRFSYQNPVETFAVNLMGTVNLLDALRRVEKPSAAVFITSDKCYENREWVHSYREEDSMGGYDPYSSSKGCSELAIASFRRSFFSKGGASHLALASARAGNVIGGGDWAADRIIPDCIHSLLRKEPIRVRNPCATRPWQHVLEPLSGYLRLGQLLHAALGGDLHGSGEIPLQRLTSAFNFGPRTESNRSVQDLVEEILKHWPGTWLKDSDPTDFHEAGFLGLAIDKAFHLLRWQPVWDFSRAVEATVDWYRKTSHWERGDPSRICEITRAQMEMYLTEARRLNLPWTAS